MNLKKNPSKPIEQKLEKLERNITEIDSNMISLSREIDTSPTGETKETEEPKYIVEKIKTHRWLEGEKQYRIKWVGYSERENTWETYDAMQEDIPDMVKEYENKLIQN